MGKYNWNAITREHVLKAIEIFLEENPEYPEARSTFLLYEGRRLPAKHIRGMAYKVAFGIEVPKEDYTGGAETERFFKRLGFNVEHIVKMKDDMGSAPKAETEKEAYTKTVPSEKRPLKIAMYLQTDEVRNKRSFTKVIEQVKNSDIDILVFPECCYTPFERKISALDISSDADREIIKSEMLALSSQAGCAVVSSFFDRDRRIYSAFANSESEGDDTVFSTYIKHTMTEWSAFQFADYREKDWFEIIKYRGWRIGLTICYDCNHAVFSRMYGLQDVDILLNSTGGNVIYDKWFKYNQVRSIENSCYSFVTMGGAGLAQNPKSYAYGFTPEGRLLDPVLINGENDSDKNNKAGGIYVYTTSESEQPAVDGSLDQVETVNKKQHLFLPVGGMDTVLNKSEKVKENLYVQQVRDYNVVYCVVHNDDIFRPEVFLPLLYAEELSRYKNRCFIIVSRFDYIPEEIYESKLSVTLKVRAMENFSAVILESDNYNRCYQTGNNRTAQVVRAEDGLYGIDLTRTSGGDAIWRNKNDGLTKACWRDNYEWLVRNMEMLADRAAEKTSGKS